MASNQSTPALIISLTKAWFGHHTCFVYRKKVELINRAHDSAGSLLSSHIFFHPTSQPQEICHYNRRQWVSLQRWLPTMAATKAGKLPLSPS